MQTAQIEDRGQSEGGDYLRQHACGGGSDSDRPKRLNLWRGLGCSPRPKAMVRWKKCAVPISVRCRAKQWGEAMMTEAGRLSSKG